ncbi:MAG TPA: VOC family protein [Burkholderiales bacterium]|nr:VOC family protein [Burkholderiales bacterium]
MRAHVRCLDHVVILVRDLDRARDTYARLGFTLTPRGYHSLGSQNHCIMFGRDYLELMAVPKPHPAIQYFSDFLAKGEGLGAVALATDDAEAAHADLVKSRIAAQAPLALSRPVQDLGEARFSLVQLPPAQTPGFHTFLCQHHTREIVWRAEYQAHALGATDIAGLAIVADDASPYAAVFGGKPRRIDDGVLVETGSAPILFSSAGRIAKRLEGASLPTLAPPCVAALFVRVADRARAASVLRRGGFAAIALRDGSFAVGADQAHGVALVFG